MDRHGQACGTPPQVVDTRSGGSGSGWSVRPGPVVLMVPAVPAARQRGMTLVSLLVASALGLVLAVLAVLTWQSSTAQYRAASGRLQLEEQAQLALELIGRALRQAGYAHPVVLNHAAVRPGLPVAVLGCERGVLTRLPGSV